MTDKQKECFDRVLEILYERSMRFGETPEGIAIGFAYRMSETLVRKALAEELEYINCFK